MDCFRKTALIAASASLLLLVGCEKDDPAMKLLPLNKWELKVVSDSTESIYATEKNSIELKGLTLIDTLNAKEVTPDDPSGASDTTVMINLDGSDVGHIIYKDGEIESAEIYGWARISRASKSSFDVRGLKGKDSPYVLIAYFTSKHGHYLPRNVNIR